MRPFPSFSAAVLAVLAGCLHPGDAPGEAEPSPAQMPADALVLAGCHGWTAYRTYVAPGPAGPGGDLPPGWEAATAGSPFSVSIDAFRCDRVHIGPFERGPLRLLFESHSNAEFPAACASGLQGTTNLWVLHQVLVD